MSALGRRAARADRRLLRAAARARGPVTDPVLVTASRLANRSALWLGVAAALTATGRRRPRTAAASGLLGIGLASGLANGPLKFAWRRDRPPAGMTPLLPLPRTFSFPSGHSASAFAFATGVGLSLPSAAPVVLPAAAAVAYSRVHTGVHYPSDVVVGSAVGIACGAVAARVVRGMRERSVHHPEAAPLPMAVPRRAVLVANDGSGSAAGLTAALDTLAEAGVHVEQTVQVTDLDDLAALLGGNDAPPMVIAAGGDGTVGAVADMVAGTDTVLMVLPLGTSNDVARSFGIPPDGAEAAAALAAGQISTVDAAEVRVDGRRQVFLNAATAGLNVAFAGEAGDRSLRDRLGGLTYPVAAARALRGYRPFHCTLIHDEGELHLDVVHLSVSNAPVFGGLLGMRVPGASISDGRLDVIAVERLSLARSVYAVLDTLVGSHRPVRRVHAFTARRVRIEPRANAGEPGTRGSGTTGSGAGEQIAVDGELLGSLPAEFSVLPGGVRVVLPRITA